MNSGEVKKDILAFVYAERLKAALLTTGQLLDALAGLSDMERQGALKMLSSFGKAVGADMRLAARVLEAHEWRGLDAQFDLVEGFARLGKMEAARKELSRTLSQVTTLSGRAMTSLKDAGLI